MLIWKSDEMLTCCVVTAEPDACDLLMFVADGQLPVVEGLDVGIDNLPKLRRAAV